MRIRRIITCVLLSLIIVLHASILQMILNPIVTSAPYSAEILSLWNFLEVFGNPILLALTLVIIPAAIIILINVSKIELNIRISISRVLSFSAMITLLITILIVYMPLVDYANTLGYTNDTKFTYSIITLLIIIAIVIHFVVTLLLTIKLQYNTT